MQGQGWLQVAAVVVSIIAATWLLSGRLAAVEVAVSELRREVAAEFQEVESEITAVRTELAELRSYFVDHLDGHAPRPE